MAKGPRKANKTTFVLQFPEETPAKKIAEAAAAEGISLTEKYVYIVRSNARKKEGKGAVKVATATATVKAAKPAADQSATFQRMLMAMGFDRAEKLIAETKSKIEAAIG